MAKRNKRGQRSNAVIPGHLATRLLDFIEWKRFTKDWQNLRLDDEDLLTLQLAMMADPKAGAVVEGTGGLRKLRFAPPSWKTGKSGATRVCYVYFEDFSLVFLIRAYTKSERDDLNKIEKAAIKKLISTVGQMLAEKS